MHMTLVTRQDLHALHHRAPIPWIAIVSDLSEQCGRYLGEPNLGKKHDNEAVV